WASVEARALVQMMLLGRESEGHDELEDEFARAGLAHVVAISGFNLAILAGALGAVLRLTPLPRAANAAIIAGVTIGYALLVVPQAPVARAAIVAFAAASADAWGRRWYGDAILAGAAALIVAVQPREASGAGFQLTFLSVLALRHLAPRLHERWYGRV